MLACTCTHAQHSTAWGVSITYHNQQETRPTLQSLCQHSDPSYI
jgi:hypothetical protein